MDHTRADIDRLRADYERAPRVTALPLAQKLSWHSMELALANQPEASEATWLEALEVVSHVLTGPGPSQLERTELIRINIGTARCMTQAGRPHQALAVLEQAETQYQALATAAADPSTVLALRGSILTVRAEAQRELGDVEAAIDSLSEALLELLAGSEVNPMIVRAMVREPLGTLASLIA